jgi:hypothetical protein
VSESLPVHSLSFATYLVSGAVLTCAPNSLVVVGSLSSTDGKNVHEIWSGERWPQRFFLKDFPQSRVLIFQRGFQKSEGLRAAIQRLGGLLVDVLDKFRQDLEV